MFESMKVCMFRWMDIVLMDGEYVGMISDKISFNDLAKNDI